MIKTDIQYLGASWKMMGRPLMVIPIRKSLLGLYVLHYNYMFKIRILESTQKICDYKMSFNLPVFF